MSVKVWILWFPTQTRSKPRSLPTTLAPCHGNHDNLILQKTDRMCEHVDSTNPDLDSAASDKLLLLSQSIVGYSYQWQLWNRQWTPRLALSGVGGTPWDNKQEKKSIKLQQVITCLKKPFQFQKGLIGLALLRHSSWMRTLTHRSKTQPTWCVGTPTALQAPSLKINKTNKRSSFIVSFSGHGLDMFSHIFQHHSPANSPWLTPEGTGGA